MAGVQIQAEKFAEFQNTSVRLNFDGGIQVTGVLEEVIYTSNRKNDIHQLKLKAPVSLVPGAQKVRVPAAFFIFDWSSVREVIGPGNLKLDIKTTNDSRNIPKNDSIATVNKRWNQEMTSPHSNGGGAIARGDSLRHNLQGRGVGGLKKMTSWKLPTNPSVSSRSVGFHDDSLRSTSMRSSLEAEFGGDTMMDEDDGATLTRATTIQYSYTRLKSMEGGRIRMTLKADPDHEMIGNLTDVQGSTGNVGPLIMEHVTYLGVMVNGRVKRANLVAVDPDDILTLKPPSFYREADDIILTPVSSLR